MSKTHWTGFLAVAALVLASACGTGDTGQDVVSGGADTEAPGTSDTGGPAAPDDADESARMRIIHSTGSVQPHRINGYAAPLLYGEEYGLNVTEEDVQLFDSHSTAAQVLLSGRAEVLGSSFVTALQLVEKGQEVRLFCPYSRSFPSQIIGTGDVTTLEQVTDPDVTVAIESPGGPVNFAMDNVFLTRDIGITTAELENISILEDSDLRLAALANGDVDVALLNNHQVPALIEELGEENVHTLSDVVEDTSDKGVMLAFVAAKTWLDSNLEAATNFCASVIRANREFASDFELFSSTVAEHMDPAPEEHVLRATWDALREGDLFPLNQGLTEDAVNFSIGVAEKTGLVEPGLTYDDVVDARAIDAAIDKLGGEVDPSEL